MIEMTETGRGQVWGLEAGSGHHLTGRTLERYAGVLPFRVLSF